MKYSKAFASVIALSRTAITLAECPNACSGHGVCGAKDMCICERNWQGSDCSLRTCPFGKAHVDVPLGDLDHDNTISPHNVIKIEGSTVYPYGTSESYPFMVDTANNLLTNTAHGYAECSNKGLCDRVNGECECLPGYEGAACQRASCPSLGVDKVNNRQNEEQVKFISQRGVLAGAGTVFEGKALKSVAYGICSGHGTCMTVEELAEYDNGNVYDLWDKEASMGCKCDPGYSGAACEERMCPYGVDPLWIDDTTVRVTQTAVRFQTNVGNELSGQYAIKFYDVYGEDYTTIPLNLSPTGSGHCDDVEAALKGLPNNAVPDVSCSLTPINTNEGFEYTLTFIGNPGKLRQLEIIEKLYGNRSAVLAPGGYTASVYTKVNGEFIDYFSKKCEGVTLKVVIDTDPGTNDWNSNNVRPGSLGYLTDMDAAEIKLLKKCLGDSDGNEDNNVDVANWDEGAIWEAHDSPATAFKMIGSFPHAIKVVPKEDMPGYNAYTPAQHYLIWYDSTATAGKEFRVANINENNNDPSFAQESYVFATDGIVRQLGWSAGTELADNQAGGSSTHRIVARFDPYTNKLYTNYDTSCENQSNSMNHQCIEKGDKLFIIDSCWGKGNAGASSPIAINPIFGGVELSCSDGTEVNLNTGNLYTVTKVYRQPLLTEFSTSDFTATSDLTASEPESIVDTFVIEVDSNIGWEGKKGDPENTSTAYDGTDWSDNTGIVTLFHFIPKEEGSYEYVSQCSNRGNCNIESGICECFSGYSGHACEKQNALAVPQQPTSITRN